MFPSHHIPACLRCSNHHPRPLPPPSPPAISGDPNLTTFVYQTNLGVFYLTWTRTFFGHSLNLFPHSQDCYPHSSASASASASPLSLSVATAAERSLSSAVSFRYHLNSFAFWRKRGSKRVSQRVKVFWDFTRVKFGSGPEPRSGFYIAVVLDGEMGLLVGDAVKEAYARTRAGRPTIPQALILRREHVIGTGVFCTVAKIGGINREISIDCRVDEDARLCFGIDSKRVLQIKRLRWKFRGNEKIEVDGVPVHISWDVYNWLFENKPAVNVNGNGNSDGNGGGYAVFMFRLESDPVVAAEVGYETASCPSDITGVVSWKPKQCGFVEWRKMRRSFLRSGRTRSSSSLSMSMSMSSASSACSNSVLEWASSADEAECGGGVAGGGGSGGGLGFSLIVYAWRK